MKRIRKFIFDNLVVVLFVAFTGLGFILSKGISPIYFLGELIDRVFRNGFLVISLIIPVIAGLGLNFGIVVGAMAGQFALIFIRYNHYSAEIVQNAALMNLTGGMSGLMLSFLFATPIALLFGWLTGKLYNKVRGQEMIASLI